MVSFLVASCLGVSVIQGQVSGELCKGVNVGEDEDEDVGIYGVYGYGLE